MSKVIHLQNLKFEYTSQQNIYPVLDIPELSFNKNETTFLFGPSGSGKTTLLEILAGVLKSQQGSVQILDQDLQKLNSAERDLFRAQHIGYIFQQFNLVPYLTVEENILLPFVFNHKKNDEKLYQQILNELGLSHLEQKLASELSVGQQQRVAAARALISKPEIIFADEPTSALDYDHRENFLKILFSLVKQQQTTLIFVSHDRSIQDLFDRKLNLLDVNKVHLAVVQKHLN
ncbi:MAG: ABC transporter ATP-binding protein [Pseudobdellovibrio sp.]